MKKIIIILVISIYCMTNSFSLDPYSNLSVTIESPGFATTGDLNDIFNIGDGSINYDFIIAADATAYQGGYAHAIIRSFDAYNQLNKEADAENLGTGSEKHDEKDASAGSYSYYIEVEGNQNLAQGSVTIFW
jgi:hypothetical protein